MLNTQTQAIELTAKLFRGFSDTSRLSILAALRVQPLNVSELVRITGLSQSNISNHLGCLKDCGLVTAQQSGRYVIYGLSDDRVADLLALAEDLLIYMAQGVYECTRYGISPASNSGQESESDE